MNQVVAEKEIVSIERITIPILQELEIKISIHAQPINIAALTADNTAKGHIDSDYNRMVLMNLGKRYDFTKEIFTVVGGVNRRYMKEGG